MKTNRFLSLLAIPFLILFLAACTIEVKLDKPVSTNFKVSSDFGLSKGKPVLCTNEDTIITYKFTSGDATNIRSWEQTLEYGSSRSDTRTVMPGDANVSLENSVFTTSINFDPILPASQGFASAAITVAPIVAKLIVRVEDRDGNSETHTTDFLVRNCAVASDFSFHSSYTLNGQPIVCDNLSTTIEYDFYAPDPNQIRDWAEHYDGIVSGQSRVEGPYTVSRSAILEGNRVHVKPRTFGANSGFLPLNLESEAIIIVPIDPPSPMAKVGETILTVVVKAKSNQPNSEGSINLPIYGNCPTN